MPDLFLYFFFDSPIKSVYKISESYVRRTIGVYEKRNLYASSPIKWPFADNQFILWGNGKDDIIKLSPNLFSWALIPCSLIISLYLIYRNKDKKLIFLLAGYLASYIPFFLISRPVFLYHYIIPLV